MEIVVIGSLFSENNRARRSKLLPIRQNKVCFKQEKSRIKAPKFPRDVFLATSRGKLNNVGRKFLHPREGKSTH